MEDRKSKLHKDNDLHPTLENLTGVKVFADSRPATAVVFGKGRAEGFSPLPNRKQPFQRAEQINK